MGGGEVFFKFLTGGFPGAPEKMKAKTLHAHAESLGSTPAQGTGSCKPQPKDPMCHSKDRRSLMLQLSLYVATKIQPRRINK